ncbi:MAG TPA: hypothetical protein DHU55_20040 [Blastocatellia bacterium]|nr:hypothetical protein [Blastocatellia bacterium]
MPFPEVQRVLYHRNPLNQVVCQLRFSPILKIDAEVPAAFQDKVRGFFCNFAETAEWNVEVQSPEAGILPPDLLRQAIQAGKNYEFSSDDGQWKINLTRTFVALTATKYERWEQFKDKLIIPFQALIDVYSPEHLSRIGLRYVDVINRLKLGLVGVEWKELLQPYILGVLSSPVGDNVSAFESKYEIKLSDQLSLVRILTKFVKEADTGELCYMIDSDFFNAHKTPVDKAFENLDYLNSRASRLIQWCVTEKLHRAMEPQPL